MGNLEEMNAPDDTSNLMCLQCNVVLDALNEMAVACSDILEVLT